MTDNALAPVRRALLSVSDKTGLLEFAQALSDRGVELLSTGGHIMVKNPKIVWTMVFSGKEIT